MWAKDLYHTLKASPEGGILFPGERPQSVGNERQKPHSSPCPTTGKCCQYPVSIPGLINAGFQPGWAPFISSSDAILQGVRFPQGGLFSASTQTAPLVTRTIKDLLPPDSKHMLSHSGTQFCSLTLLSSYLGTVAHAHVPSTCSPTYAQSQTTSPASPTGIYVQSSTPRPGKDWGYHTDATLTHHSAILDATRTDRGLYHAHTSCTLKRCPQERVRCIWGFPQVRG